MRLSEAIRLGAMLRPQIHNSRLVSNRGTCAFGAALDAVGDLRGQFVKSQVLYDRLEKRWGELLRKRASVHGLSYSGDTVRSIVWCLNDCERWPRERIADWVATIEQQQDAEQSKDVETPVPAEA